MTFLSSTKIHYYLSKNFFIILLFVLSLSKSCYKNNEHDNINKSHKINQSILFVTAFHYAIRKSSNIAFLQDGYKKRIQFFLHWNDVTQQPSLHRITKLTNSNKVLCFAHRRSTNNNHKNTNQRRKYDTKTGKNVIINQNISLVSSTQTLESDNNFLDHNTIDEESWNEDFSSVNNNSNEDTIIPDCTINEDDMNNNDENEIPPSFYDDPGSTTTIYENNDDETDDEDEDNFSNRIHYDTRYSSNNNETSWLEQATADILDREQYPVGTLTEDDMDVICGLMASWPRRKSVQAAIQVEQLLKRIIDDMKYGNIFAHVTSRMYTYAIDAWAKSGVAGSAHRAQHIHDSMVQMYKETNDPLLAPSVVSYNALINAWGKCHPADSHLATIQAEKDLAEMLDAMKQRNNTSSSTPNTSDRISSIPRELENDSDYETIQSYNNNPYTEGDHYYKDDVVLINGVVCNANNYNVGAWNELKPDAITFSTLLDTYAKQSGITSGVENPHSIRERRIATVQRCEELFAMIDTLHIKKNAYTYSALQNVYARSGLPNAPNKTMDVLHEMISLYQKGDVYAKPNAINYNGTYPSIGCAKIHSKPQP